MRVTACAGCAGGMLDIGRSMMLVPPRLEQPTDEALAPAPGKVYAQKYPILRIALFIPRKSHRKQAQYEGRLKWVCIRYGAD